MVWVCCELEPVNHVTAMLNTGFSVQVLRALWRSTWHLAAFKSVAAPVAWPLSSRDEHRHLLSELFRSVKVLAIQLCLTLCDPMDCGLPVSSVLGILQARIPEWVALLFSRVSPNPGIKPGSPTLLACSLPSEPPCQWAEIKPWIFQALRLSVMHCHGIAKSLLCQMHKTVRGQGAFGRGEHTC